MRCLDQAEQTIHANLASAIDTFNLHEKMVDRASSLRRSAIAKALVHLQPRGYTKLS